MSGEHKSKRDYQLEESWPKMAAGMMLGDAHVREMRLLLLVKCHLFALHSLTFVEKNVVRATASFLATSLVNA